MGEHDQHRQRLRERYISNGLNAFADHEVLELLLTYAIPRVNTNEIAHRLLNRFGSISKVLAADTAELCQVEGIGPTSAVMLHLIDELIQRLELESLQTGKNVYLDSPRMAAQFVSALLRNERSAETVYTICLDKNNRVLFTDRVVKGSLTEVPLYPRTIAQIAFRHNAKSVILAHNHPSGDPHPSEEDKIQTRNVQKALEALDISLYDHLIAGRNAVYSFNTGYTIHLTNESDSGDAPSRLSPRNPQQLLRAAEKSQPAMRGTDNAEE